jgi:hypothetical protein
LTVIFAGIHGLGEVIYLVLTGTFTSELALPGKFPNENLIMVLGIALLSMISVIAISFLVKQYLKSWFHFLHRTLAFLLLATAAGHFWAFAILLIPASSLHAVASALFVVGQFKSLAQSSTTKFPNQKVAQLVMLSFLTNLVCFLCIWYGRALYMIQESAGLMVPFIFPPLVIVCGFGCSFAVCAIFLKCTSKHVNGN